MKEYKIVAYGPSKEGLTWANEINLDITKERLRREGYLDIRAEEEGGERP